MDLLPASIAAVLPDLYAQDGLGLDAVVHLKLFTPASSWTWYVTEGRREEDGDWTLFGKVVSPFVPEGELGYFSLRELEEVCSPFGVWIERDLWWEPRPLRDCT